MSAGRFFIAAVLACLPLLPVTPVLAQAPPPAQAQVKALGDIAGDWTAMVLGQTVTASFTRQGSMISGVVVIPELGGGSNTYHLAGVVLNNEFAAQHGSGHLLKGAMLGPNDAEAVFTPKSGPPLQLHLKRR